MAVLCKRALRDPAICTSIAKDYTDHPNSSTTHAQAHQAVSLLRRFHPRAFDRIVPYVEARIILDENWRTQSILWIEEDDVTDSTESINFSQPHMNGPDGPISWTALVMPYLPPGAASDSTVQTSLTPTPRVREGLGSERERAVRRRRREAIVLNEGDRPLTQDDIIQRPMAG
jgi:hypothetical protein